MLGAYWAWFVPSRLAMCVPMFSTLRYWNRPYSPKAVRASVGGLFHLPVLTGAESGPLLEALAARGITAAATSGHADSELFDVDLPERLAWILGNEARGLDAHTLAAAPLTVRIPLAGHAESLNVHTAATVCLFETLRRRRAGA